MKVSKPNSFILIMGSWLIMNLIYAIVTARQFGKTNDSGVILFWSGIYIILSWVVFIWVPMKISNRLKFGKSIYFASPIMGVYSVLVYTILLGKTFDFGETYIFFLPYAFLTGLIYGFLLTITKFKRKAENYLLLIIPIVGISFYVIFPYAMPSQAFRFMPDKTQDKIVSRIIPKIKVGDPYRIYLDKLPNAFNSAKGLKNAHVWVMREDEVPEDYSTSMHASNEFISFDMKVEKGIITELNYILNK